MPECRDPAWDRLKDGTVKIYKTNEWLFRYTICNGEGVPVSTAITLWGARRVVRGLNSRPFWEFPTVE